MRSSDYWQLFLETGAPEAYLMYSQALKTEGIHVFDSPGDCSEGNRLQ